MEFNQALLKSWVGVLVLGWIMLLPVRTIALPTSPIKVPGTAVSLTPPAGFKASQLFSGFEQQLSGASITVTELPIPQSDQKTALEKLSSPEVLKMRGIRLLNLQDTIIDRHRSKLLLVSQEVRGTPFLQWIAILTQGDRAVMVVTSFPKAQAKTLQEPLRQAILNLKWTPNLQIDPLGGLPFSFTPAGDLKIWQRMSSMVALTQNGVHVPSPQAASKPFLLVGSAYQEIQIPDIALFSRKHLQQVSAQIRDLVEISGDRKTVAGQRAFEIVAQGVDISTQIPLTVYLTIIATEKTYYIVQGFVPKADAKKYLPIFRTIAESVRTKI
jgi:hypothetical protein